MRLTDNFTLEELTNSNTANRFGIKNEPTKEGISKLKVLCETILQPIRNEFGKPITVSSGYRSPELNKMVHGAKNSQHCKYEAADIKSSNNKELFELIVKMIKNKKITVGQLINECNYSWIHISTGNRNQIL